MKLLLKRKTAGHMSEVLKGLFNALIREGGVLFLEGVKDRGQTEVRGYGLMVAGFLAAGSGMLCRKLLF